MKQLFLFLALLPSGVLPASAQTPTFKTMTLTGSSGTSSATMTGSGTGSGARIIAPSGAPMLATGGTDDISTFNVGTNGTAGSLFDGSGNALNADDAAVAASLANDATAQVIADTWAAGSVDVSGRQLLDTDGSTQVLAWGNSDGSATFDDGRFTVGNENGTEAWIDGNAYLGELYLTNGAIGPIYGTPWVINSDGSFKFASGNVFSDDAGNFFAEALEVYNSSSLDGGAITTDGFGDLTAISFIGNGNPLLVNGTPLGAMIDYANSYWLNCDDAQNDGYGNNINETYATQSGYYPAMIVGEATTADEATTATYDPSGYQLYGIGASVYSESIQSFATDTYLNSDGGGDLIVSSLTSQSGITVDGDTVFDSSGNLWLNNAYVDGAITPTGSLIIYDSTGTAYQIPAVLAP